MNFTLTVSPREKLGMNMGIMAAMTTLGPSLAIVLSGVILTFAPWTTLMWVLAGLTLAVLVAGGVILRNVVELGRPVVDALFPVGGRWTGGAVALRPEAAASNTR